MVQRNLQELLWEASKKRKKPLLGSDDGKFHFKKPLRDPNPVNYQKRLKFHNPGCVDPVR